MANNEQKGVLLISGDPYLVENIVRDVKRKYFPKGVDSSCWVEFDKPESKVRDKKFMSETLNDIGAEVSCPPLDGIKFIVIKHMPSNKAFIEFCTRILGQIPDQNRVIFWDTVDSVYGSFAKWKAFVELVQKTGKVIRKDPALDTLKRAEQEEWAVSYVSSKKRNISRHDAGVLLDMVGPDRRMLIGEIDKILQLGEGQSISKEDIETHVFPIASDFPIYLFYGQINKGNVDGILESANALVANSGFSYDIVLGLALKQIRWHVAVAHAVCHGHDGKDALQAMGSGKNLSTAVEKFHRQFLSGQFWKPIEEGGTPPKPETLTNFYSIADISNYVGNVLPGRVPVNTSMSARQWALSQSMNKYAVLYNAMVDCRLFPKDAAAIFYRAIRQTHGG